MLINPFGGGKQVFSPKVKKVGSKKNPLPKGSGFAVRGYAVYWKVQLKPTR